jgi:hypothetical protein
MSCYAWLVILGTTGAVLFCLLGGWIFQSKFAVQTSLKGAELAIQTLGDWSKWMAGIDTAAIAGLAYLCFKPETHDPVTLKGWSFFFAVLGLVTLGLALLSVAWILSSLASFAVRIYSKDDPEWSGKFDIHEGKMFARGGPKLSFIVTTHHWLWGCGLISAAALIIVRVVGAPTP